ncbi:MAG TPA: hypothetical protein VJM34_18745 [Novosphingobium sp.]|nr:hypothetical protein [Novosphingobium sp.]
MRLVSTLIAATLASALAACGSGDAGKQASGKSEILAPSVSDEMLPYDTVQSQPPLAAPTFAPDEDAGKTGGGAPPPAADASAAASDAAEAPAAAETPEGGGAEGE